jgi:hypothetical protein
MGVNILLEMTKDSRALKLRKMFSAFSKRARKKSYWWGLARRIPSGNSGEIFRPRPGINSGATI